MRALPSAAAAALSRSPLPLAALVEMDLTPPLYLNSSPMTLTLDGATYLGAGTLGRIEAVKESPAEIKPIRFELSGVPASQIALALAEPVQGKAVRVLLAIFDPDSYQLLSRRLIWAGRLNTIAFADGPQAATLSVTAEHAGIDLLRPVTSLYSDTEQRRLYAGDPSLQFMADQVDLRIVWPTAEFFKR